MLTSIVAILSGTVGAIVIWLMVRLINRKSKVSRACITWALLTLLVCYPAAIGPLQWLVWNTEIPWLGETVQVMYWPVFMICQKSELARRMVESYIGLWVDWRQGPGINLPVDFEKI